MEKMNSVLVRYSEIGLKGNNRSYFEKLLIQNIKDCLDKNKIKYYGIFRYSGRIISNSEDKCLCLKNVFGISSFSPAIKVEQDLEKIKEVALSLYKKGTFRISAKRLNKKFKLTSDELNRSLGEFIIQNKKARVNLIRPDSNIGLEIMDNVYLFNERYECLGGLPVNSEGLVTLILENKNDLLAGLLMLKRGCSLEIVNKNKLDFSILEKYSYGCKINLVSSPSSYSLAIVKTDTLEDTKNKLNGKVIFNPLIASEKSFSENLIKEIKKD